MFWLTPGEISLIIHNLFGYGDTHTLSAEFTHKAVAKEQLKKFWEWGAEVCNIHHSGVCRIDCQKCIKNIKKELGI